MESIDQVKRGIANFIDAEVVPVMPKWKGIALAVGASLMIEGKTDEILNHPLVKMMGVVNGDKIDVDKLYSSFKTKAQGKWPIEIGEIKMNENDFDKLYQHIKRA